MSKKREEKIFDLNLYRVLWKRGLVGKTIYCLIPFLLIGVFGLILYFSKAWKTDGYSFSDDYTNCYMLCYIFFFVYFVHGLFLPYFNRSVNLLASKVNDKVRERYQINISFAFKTVSICSLVISLFAICFIYAANRTGNVNWYSKLNAPQLMYYSFLIVLAWIMSARLFANILINAVAIYKYLQHNISNIDFYNPDKKCGLKGLYNSLSASMGFGFYFLIAVAVIIYSDFNAHEKYGLDLLAYKYWWLIVSVAVVLAVIYFSVIIITYISLNKIIKTGIKREATSLKICNKKSDYLRNILSSTITWNDVIVFLLSVLFPGIAAIVQIYFTI